MSEVDVVQRATVPTTHDDDVVLDVRNLKLHFPRGGGLIRGPREVVRAVDGVSFQLRRGETLGIVGESGSGKSTTARGILQIERPTEGQVFFRGQDLCTLSEREVRRLRPRMQMIFQDPYNSLNTRRKVGRIIAEPLLVHDIVPRSAVHDRVRELLVMVGLRPDMAERHPRELSGGQRQRVSIARAIAPQPDLIIADEPTSALDVSVRAQILNLLRRLQDEHGLTYLFISHDLSVVRHMSARVAVMYLGNMVEIADRDAIYNAPQHPYTRALLSVVPIANPTVEKQRTRNPIAGEIPSPAHPPAGCRFHTRCPHVFGRCPTEVPPLYDLGGGHRSACFLVDESAESRGT